MADASWPSPDNGREVNDVQYEQISSPLGDGILGSPSDPAPVFADGSARAVYVRAGVKALIRGHGWNAGSEALRLDVPANTTGSARRDLAVLGLDRSTWNVSAYVRTGSAAAGPSLKRDTGDTGTYEIPLLDITTPSGATNIASGNVAQRWWWHGPHAYVCRSTGRPPHEAGLAIREIDTGRWLASTGSAWNITFEDSGKVLVASAWPSYWKPIYDITVYRRNGEVHLRVNVERRTRSTDPGSSTASYPLICVLEQEFWPPVNPQIVYYSDGGRTGIAEVGYNSGEVRLVAGDPIAVGSKVHFSATFPATW